MKSAENEVMDLQAERAQLRSRIAELESRLQDSERWLPVFKAVVESGLEYANEALLEHQRAFGETTQSNRLTALRLREDISMFKDAYTAIRAYLANART